jgi:PHD/YefM family antitoxin component YafN of YafNO toxin-antitoxin module
MEKTEILTQESFQKNIDLYVDKLVQKKLDKLLIKTPNKDDVVILAIDEYERLKTKYEQFKILTKGE